MLFFCLAHVGYLGTWQSLLVEGSSSPSIAACTEQESSTNVTVHHEGRLSFYELVHVFDHHKGEG